MNQGPTLNNYIKYNYINKVGLMNLVWTNITFLNDKIKYY